MAQHTRETMAILKNKEEWECGPSSSLTKRLNKIKEMPMEMNNPVHENSILSFGFIRLRFPQTY
jgi:hypothetical protein